MSSRQISYLALAVITAILTGFDSGTIVFAQSKSEEKPKRREFGRSLEKFEKSSKKHSFSLYEQTHIFPLRKTFRETLGSRHSADGEYFC